MCSWANTTAVRQIDLAPGRSPILTAGVQLPEIASRPSSSRRARRIGSLPRRDVSIAGGSSPVGDAAQIVVS